MVLKVENVSINFGGIKALDNISFELENGNITALIGPNGAGKTTLFNIITRYYNQDEGNIYFKDQQINKLKSHQLARTGIARTFQNIQLFNDLTLYENLIVSVSHSKKELMFQLLGMSKNTNKEIVEEIIEFFELEPYKDNKVSDLPLGIQKLTEIGRALILQPKLLLLDEPAAGLNSIEADDLARKIEEINKNWNVSVLVVEHNMSFVMNICKKIIVLDFGKKIAEGTPKEIRENERVVEAYLGSDDIA